MATRIGGGGGTTANINRTIKKSTRTSSSTSGVGAAIASAGRQETARQRASDRRLKQQVSTARAKSQRGSGARADTGDVLRGSRVAPGERQRSAKAVAAVNLSNYAIRAQLKRRESGAGPLGLVGFGRSVVNTLGGIAQATYEDPIGAHLKAAGTLVDAAKAIPQTAALAGGLATYPARRALRGFDDPEKGDAAINAGSDLVKGVKEHVVDYYGDSYKGAPGAYDKLAKKIKRDGPLVAAMDLATVVAPTSAAVGAAGRAGTLGSAARNVATSTTKVRYGRDVVERAQRRGAAGIATREAHNAARRAVQKRAVRRVANGKAAGLPLHRALLGEDEVAPVFNRRAERRQRFLTAEEDNRARTRAKQRLRKFVGGADGLIQAQRLVEPELRPVVAIARQLGIRKPEDVAKIVPDRIAEIEQRRAEALAGTGEYAQLDSAAARRGAAEDLSVELGRLRALVEDPSIFARPEMRESIERQAEIFESAVGTREGLGRDQLEEGRAGLQGATVGVERQKAIAKRERAAHKDAVAAARAAEESARAARDQLKTAVQRDLTKARTAVAAAKARADVPGPGQPRRRATLAKARENLAAVQARASDDLSQATSSVLSAVDARKAVAAQKPLKRAKETGAEYAARVDAAFAERGLAKPGYASSRFEEFEDPLPTLGITQSRPSTPNPSRHKRAGTNYRLGQQGHQPEVEARTLRQQIERGAKIEGWQNVLERQGLYFNSKPELEEWVRGQGLDPDSVVSVQTTLVAKDTAGLVMKPGDRRKDAGDYVSSKGGVWAVPKAVHDELQALDAPVKPPVRVMRRLAHAPQTALLALSPSWFVFQRVNDLVGMAFGGSILQARGLQRARRELRAEHPDAADIVELMSGGTASSDMLTPMAGQKLGRLQRVIDENPKLRDAWHSDTPASALLELSPKWDKVLSPRAAAVGGVLAKKAPTALLRADARITGAAREIQYLQNLQRIAAKMDPEVKRVNRALGPMGHALKTGDIDLIKHLLEDPKWHRAREEAAIALNKVMGDWHSFTAKERSVKDFFAFYGFLRYSTRMLFYTLPVDHPLLALTIAQLGHANAEQAKAIIGDDLPYGLGALYARSGKVITDLTRANPITGPLVSIDKPEKLLNLASPLASIVMSGVFGFNAGLSDSSTGYLKQLTSNGDPNDKSLTPADRLQILADRTLSLLSPYKMAKGADPRQQTDDSLVFNRQIARSPESATAQAKINRKNASAGPGGWKSVLADAFPLFFSDGRNWREIGERASSGKADAQYKESLRKAKRRGAANDPGAELDVLDAELDLAEKDADKDLEALDRELELIDAELGLK